MQIAFYGTAGHVGTSANMAAVSAALWQRYFVPSHIRRCSRRAGTGTGVVFTDCTGRKDAGIWMETCDLLVLNLNLPHHNLEQLYYSYPLVRKNVLFLIGKYFKDNPVELKKLAEEYRIAPSRICTVPYHAGFADAYETHRIPQFLAWISGKGAGGMDLQFQKQLFNTAGAVIRFAGRKGEFYYG